MSEIWTAKSIEGEMIVFEVENEQTGETRTEERYVDALPLMFSLGGYPPQIGTLMKNQQLPWRFRMVGTQIYIDGPSAGVNDYHPIDK